MEEIRSTILDILAWLQGNICLPILAQMIDTNGKWQNWAWKLGIALTIQAVVATTAVVVGSRITLKVVEVKLDIAQMERNRLERELSEERQLRRELHKEQDRRYLEDLRDRWGGTR